MLTSLAKSSFNAIIEISLWISLIGFIIGGWNFGSTLGIPGILGAFFGVLTFVITVLPFYGLIALCINMDKNIELLNENVESLNRKVASSNNESGSSSGTKAPW